MALLGKLEVVQIGPGLAAAVCTRLLADMGAHPAARATPARTISST